MSNRNVKVARKKLDILVDTLQEREITIPSLCRYLNNTFNSMSIRFTSKLDDFFSISGFFAGSVKLDNELRYNIHIDYDEKGFKINPKELLIDEIFPVIVHEFRHGYQERQRGKKQLKHQHRSASDDFSYLSDKDEIDANAFEAANCPNSSNWLFSRYKEIFSKDYPEYYHRFLKKAYTYGILNK